MKYATLILGAALLLASIITARADNIIPAPYRGTWCEISNRGNASEYKRCREPDGEQDFQIGAGLISNGEAFCVPFQVAAERGGLLIRSKCRIADQPTENSTFHLRLIDGGRLVISD